MTTRYEHKTPLTKNDICWHFMNPDSPFGPCPVCGLPESLRLERWDSFRAAEWASEISKLPNAEMVMHWEVNRFMESKRRKEKMAVQRMFEVKQFMKECVSSSPKGEQEFELGDPYSDLKRWPV